MNATAGPAAEPVRGRVSARNAAVAVWAVFAMAACYVGIPAAAPAGGTRPVDDRPVDERPEAAEVAAGVLAESNRVRVGQGLHALRPDDALRRAAAAHALELAGRQALDHVSVVPDLRTPADRVEAAGATWVRVAENLASTTSPAAAVPRTTVRLWLTSPGHRANLLEAAYTHTGVGVATGADGHWYIVQLYTVPGTVPEGSAR
jgi:uncharacterized protein YkwD